ncbi:MAG: Rossmann-like domain-containing protein [Peptococcales bacterium]
MEEVLAAAEPYLGSKTVSDLVIGISLIACQLDNGDIGVSYVLREELPRGCSNFPFAQHVIGKPASVIATWAISGENALQKAVGTAVLNAASSEQNLPDDTLADRPFGVELRPTDTVGMVGFIGPVVRQISGSVKQIIAFDKGMSLEESELLYPMAKQPELLATCDIVIISGTTTINGTIDGLLKMCSQAREIIMVGPSTPMIIQGWKHTPITRLAGSFWDKNHKDEIFKVISLGGGISTISKYMLKKAVAIK